MILATLFLVCCTVIAYKNKNKNLIICFLKGTNKSNIKKTN